jgi:hypothetical protein
MFAQRTRSSPMSEIVLTFVALSQNIPQLPLEIYGLIAEHLTGDHAFATAGRLNRVSRAVHAETSSVLWESLYLDGYSWRRWENRLPANAKYTKYA